MRLDRGMAGWLCVATVVGMFYFLNASLGYVFPLCPLHALTGLHCPGCGATRAVLELLHGHMLAALQMNVMAVTALPVLGLWLARHRGVTARPAWIWLLMVVVVAFGVLRNLPWAPFTSLSPQP